MAFAIVATFPMGGFRGSEGRGRPADLPSPARLHAALTAAAAAGPNAVPGETGITVPSPAGFRALAWLEEHPPEGVVAPATAGRQPTASAYRAMGQISRVDRDGTRTLRVEARPLTMISPMGEFVWTWSTAPAPDVAATLEALCREVPYLGTTESPVRLCLSDREPTHELDSDADAFAGVGHDLQVATPGRTAALLAAHRARIGRRTTRSEPTKGQETDLAEATPGAGIAWARYVPIGEPPVDAPWDRVLLLPLSAPVQMEYRVAWAVAAHRALIAQIGADVPALLTGNYPQGMARPANRLALQFLDAADTSQHDIQAACLAVMVPAGAVAEDLAPVWRAARSLRVIRGPGGRTRTVAGEFRLVSGARFWPVSRASGMWSTASPAIPESRGPRGGGWTLADAAIYSVGMVWRDPLATCAPRGDAGVAQLHDAAAAAGVAVRDARRVTTDPSRYVHHTNGKSVLQPYMATLSLARLDPGRALIAIGQSRHLGGGLLRPTRLEETTDEL